MSRDLRVFRLFEPEIDDRGFEMTFEITPSSSAISGIQQLVQKIAKALLTTPGRDVRDPLYGAGIRRFLATPLSRSEAERRQADMVAAVVTVKDQIIARQNEELLEEAELLEDLDVETVEYNPSEGTWLIQVRVVSRAGAVVVDLGGFLKQRT